MTTSKHTRFGAVETADLRSVEGLQHLDDEFLGDLQAQDQVLHQELLAYRLPGHGLTPLETSEFLLALAPHVEGFIAGLFGIEQTLLASKRQTLSHDEVMAFKKNYVMRRARRYRGEVTQSFAELDDWLNQQLQKEANPDSDREAAVAHYGMQLLDVPAIEQLTRWCLLALRDRQGQEEVKGWISFKLPQRVDHADLVPLQRVDVDKESIGAWQSAPEKLRRRDGFKLTDQRMSAREVQNEAHYCIYCHNHEGDYCSKGFPCKKGDPGQGFKTDPFGITLTGCPLEEKISEMHQLKRDGRTIAALAMAMADNPMIPATGHRICNDCMKACIYQKQDPVNIPQIETRILTDVLILPWGVEIYDLLTRWNPLRHTQYLPKPYNGHKVLIVGQGPAGFTMAHHLTMEGCAVVGIDGLKIEPLPEDLLKKPVRDYADLAESLDTRILTGFGGVAEYGITVRWDKNFLKLIYLSLARRPAFQVFGGVRLGG
ncbi:MAG TPA: pyridine nucleotide-disulfide oxidoreductase, partial [Gammaproteobacteria bacterium]